MYCPLCQRHVTFYKNTFTKDIEFGHADDCSPEKRIKNEEEIYEMKRIEKERRYERMFPFD